MPRLASLSLFALLLACSPPTPEGQPDAGSEPPPPDAALTAADAGPGPLDAGGELPDAGEPPADAGSKAAACASTFGEGLTAAFGRADGTILAVVGPTDTQCALPNSDHLVIQLTINGEAYRMVVNVLSDGRNGTDTRIRYAEVRHALVGEPWNEGWHPGASLDYPGTLGLHTADFSFYEMGPVVQRVSDHLTLGARCSVYATNSGSYRSSAHLVHRNDWPPSTDGAIVIDPDSADPLFLVFAFDGQTF